MEKYIFYFVSLSDGDASLRIRFIYALSLSEGQDAIFSPGTHASVSSITYIIEGSGTLNGKPITAGQAFYSAPHLKNFFQYNDKNTKTLVIGFDGIHQKKLLSDINIKTDEPGFIIDIRSFDALKNIYCELKNIYPKDALLETPQILSQITAKSYFYSTLRCLEEEYTIYLNTSRRKLLVLAEEYMRNNFSSDITIEEVSKYLSVDRRYLYKLFKKHSGVSPKQYLNNIRIARATELLANSEMSVTEIAELTGYKDSLQFSTFFKKQTGISPRKYRNSLQK